MSLSPFVPAMQHAIRLASQGRWQCAPNPAVGAVLVRNGHIVAEGWHHCCGEAHAEIECLKDAARRGISPEDCILVVTLEPCAHHGKTPPCTDAIIAAGIKRVVIGLRDPNPQAAGGIERLRSAGLLVDSGVCEEQCRDLVADFLVWQGQKRPYIILKLASTLDGRIATRSGHAEWVTGNASRASVHRLRAMIGQVGGVVLVGGSTLLVDNPLLTARDVDKPEQVRQPRAAVAISRLSNVGSMRLVQERPLETTIFSPPAVAASPIAASLRERGVTVVGISPVSNRNALNLHEMLAWLHAHECPYVLCEGGGKFGLSLLQAGLVDEFHMHLAPKVLGDAEAAPLFSGREPLTMQEALGLTIRQVRMCGEDCHIIMRPIVNQASRPGLPGDYQTAQGTH